MPTRLLGGTGFEVNTTSFGAWAIGGTWGDVRDDESIGALRRAIELGVNLFDTADVYGDARRPAQVEENVRAGEPPPLTPETPSRIDQLYRQRIRPLVHHRW